jgi:hypothetical protein
LRCLAEALKGGARLVKTHTTRGPAYTVGGRLCDPGIAQRALTNGWLRPADPGLFGRDTSQSWTMEVFDDDY